MDIKNVFKNKKLLVSAISIPSIILLCLAVFFISGMFRSKDKEPVYTGYDTGSISVDKIKIVPLVSDSTGVDLKSGFKITSQEACSEEYLKSSITSLPAQPFKIEKLSSTEYTLNFNNELQPNSIYKIAVSDSSGSKRSWAFQTKRSLKVSRTLPRDKAVDVPTDSGIEVTFSLENVEEIQKYFEISPKVEGRFETHRKTVVFLPKKLEEGTVYTVTVKNGLSLKGSNEKLGEDYVFKFRTKYPDNQQGQEYSKYFYITDTVNNFTSAATPVIEVQAGEYYKNKNFSIEVYKYENSSNFISDLKKYDSWPYWAGTPANNIKFEQANLEKVTSFNTKLNNSNGGFWHSSFICFPSKLSEGWYLINIKCENVTYQAHVQVNDIAAYIMANKDRSLAWINDSSTGKAVNGASVNLEGLGSFKTGSDGTVLMDGKIPASESGYYYFKVSRDQKPEFIARVFCYQNQDSRNTAVDYFSYMYLDKGLYLPSDTIRVWGIAKPRDAAPVLSKGMLKLSKTSYISESDSDMSVIAAKEVSLSPLGTFKMEMELPNLTPGTYSLQFTSNGEIVSQSYFQVRQYAKPAYKISTQFDKTSAFAWEKLNADIQASFFEGSPLPGLQLNYNYYLDGSYGEGKLICDKSGSSNVTVKPKFSSNSWRPRNLELYVSNAQAEEEEIRSHSAVTVFPSDTMIEVNTRNEGGSGIIDVRTSMIDLDRLKDKSAYWFAEDEYRGSSVNIPLKAKIYRKFWIATETGEYYDFINKKVQKMYSYTESSQLVKEVDFTTADGKYAFEFPLEKENNYFIEVTGYDSRKNKISEEVYFNLYNYYELNSNLKRYTLYENTGKREFKIGENVSLELKCNDKDIPELPEARVLFLNLKNGLVKHTVSSATDYSFRFTRDLIPNMYVQAIYFDGVNIFNSPPQIILYDYNEKELKISVTPDKEIYKPGETVNLDIDVKDTSGNPCSSEINISVVDEAFFAIQDQTVSTLPSLYSYSFSTGVLADFVSYKQLDINGSSMAEQGGEGGDESLRTTFVDNACFNSVVTDSNGKAQTSFKLPDNLTSWRVTYQGVTEDLKAGSGKVNISAKLPFFVDVILNSSYIAGDTPNITLRSFGTEFKTDGAVSYNVLLQDSSGNQKSFTADGTGSSYVNVSLGKLEEGKYSVTVEANYGSYHDAVKKEFAIVQSLLESTRVKYYNLEENLKIEGGKSLTTLSFYNAEKTPFYNTLSSMSYTWGERVDQKLSRKLAGTLLSKYYGDIRPMSENEEFSLSKYQLSDGGISLLSYDSSSPELSAKISSAAADLFDKTALKGYFYSILDNKDSSVEDVSASYWGLAALNEPVLIDIQNLLKTTSLELKEKLYLGIALAELGATSEAETIYSDVLRSKSKNVPPYLYIDTGKGRDDIVETTALCSVIALKINSEEKYSLLTYVTSNSTSEILTNLEQLIYITSDVPDKTQPSKFTIQLDGVEKEVSLDRNESFELVLTPEKLSMIRFSKISGSVSVAASYTGPVKDLMQKGPNLVGIKRSYSRNNTDTLSFKQSDLVKVTLKPYFMEAAPDGFYEVTDILPCGMRFVSGKHDDQTKWYPQEVSGQKVIFGYYYNKNDRNRIKDIVYYARAVSPGDFTADNALIKCSDSDIAGFTDTAQIIIGK